MMEDFDLLLMVRVAQMFYMKDMEQEEIAKRLKISSLMVSGILNEAIEYGIVDIKINSL